MTKIKRNEIKKNIVWMDGNKKERSKGIFFICLDECKIERKEINVI